MSNKFINLFKNNTKEKVKREKLVVAFSKKLQSALGVSTSMLDKMSSLNHSMVIGQINSASKTTGVKLVVKSRCFSDGWIDVIEAHPTDTEQFLYEGWSGTNGGTTSTILPSEENQEKILELIKAL